MSHAHRPLGSTGHKNADELLKGVVEEGLRTAAFVRNLAQIYDISIDETLPPTARLRQIERICLITLGPKHVIRNIDDDDMNLGTVYEYPEDIDAGQT